MPSIGYIIKPRLLSLPMVILMLGFTGWLPEAFPDELPPAAEFSPAPPDFVPPKPQPKTIKEPPRIFPPPIPEVPVKSNPKLLPAKAQAVFPAFDGDGFFVSIPAKPADKLLAEQVFEETVSPVLAAIGFASGEDHPSLEGRLHRHGRIRIPHHFGVPMPGGDLKQLAEITCNEFSDKKLERARLVCDALAGRVNVQPNDKIDKIIQDHEGMTFQQYVSDIQRLELEYFFPQVHRTRPCEHPNVQGLPEKVPIEHVGVRAARWEGETITSVAGRVINRYQVTNCVRLTSKFAARLAPLVLAKVKEICCPERKPERVELLLLPYGEAGGLPALRYAYRIPIVAHYERIRALFYLWLDAETGGILQLLSFIDQDHEGVSANARTFRRAPDVGTTSVRRFEVDKSGVGQYGLNLTNVFTLDPGRVTIDDNRNGSSDTFAQFDQPPYNDADADGNPATSGVDPKVVACQAGANKAFQLIDVMSTLGSHRYAALRAGLLNPFPTSEVTVRFSDTDISCFAGASHSDLHFFGCSGYTEANCPNAADKSLHYGHDHTILAHELGHLLTWHQYRYEEPDEPNRLNEWCNGPTMEGIPPPERTSPEPCPKPYPPGPFHDFADSWAHALEGTNCVGGWVAKNKGDVDASLNCRQHHDEDGGLPRLSEASQDHFPEHRHAGWLGGYADGQIAAAALWAVRQGMRSKCLPSGTPQYLVRFVRTLATTGWFGHLQGQPLNFLTSSDRDIYRGLLDLEIKLANQWATSGSPGGPPGFAHNGAHTTNKVVAGYAKAGIFMIPPACTDGDINTNDVQRCPSGESGADAVIDIDDDDVTDDADIDGFKHPEVDYLKPGKPEPIFHVWTGPQYIFNKNNGDQAEFPSQAPCNTKFRVEIAKDSAFNVILVDSGFISTMTPCYHAWRISEADWKTLTDELTQDNKDRFYYRVTTLDASDGNMRISTEPGNGLFRIPPPYAIVNATGTP